MLAIMRRANIAISLFLVAIACERTEAKPTASTSTANTVAASIQPEQAKTRAATRPLTAFEQKLARIPGGEPYDYCDVFGCKPCPTGGPCPPPQTASIIHCCNSDGICVHVQLMGDCDPDDYLVICDWGQSNADGSITCYE